LDHASSFTALSASAITSAIRWRRMRSNLAESSRRAMVRERLSVCVVCMGLLRRLGSVRTRGLGGGRGGNVNSHEFPVIVEPIPHVWLDPVFADVADRD